MRTVIKASNNYYVPADHRPSGLKMAPVYPQSWTLEQHTAESSSHRFHMTALWETESTEAQQRLHLKRMKKALLPDRC